MTRPARTSAYSALAICPVALVRPVALVCLVTLVVACGGSPTRTPATARPVTADASSTSESAQTVAASRSSAVPARPSAGTTPPTATSTTRAATAAPTRVRRAEGPVIVIDPGHSPAIRSTDPRTGLNDSDYENEPEMRDVFGVAELVEVQLEAAGYRVVMTKNSATDRVSLGQRAAVANDAHAALALSIHDQAGPNGGIQFDNGNNIVYYQSVGGYRETPTGRKITYTDAGTAATSMRYGRIFQAQRTAAEGHSVRLQSDVGYDLGSRGLPAGTIWMVQLLSRVPWIYNEAGGNSAGRSGLDASDKRKYANGLVASVERCVPIPR
jgi:N-acetylmuramoyl-L-alanine amidase